MALRTNLDILRLFQKACRENQVTNNTVEAENNDSAQQQDSRSDVRIYLDEMATAKATGARAEEKIIFNVLYRKVSSKVHKTWSDDGLLEVTGENAVLTDLDGNVIGATTIDPNNATEDSVFNIGSKQIQILERLTHSPLATDWSYHETTSGPPQKRFKASRNVAETAFASEKSNSLHEGTEWNVNSVRANTKTTFNVTYGKISSKKHKTWDNDGILEVIDKNAVLRDLSGNIIGRAKINPINAKEGSTLIVQNKEVLIIDRVSEEQIEPEKRVDVTANVPLQRKAKPSGTHDFVPLLSSRENLTSCEPLVMPRVNSAATVQQSSSDDASLQKEHEVSVDPCLTAKLRKHQRHGIVFLYECLMGLRVPDYFGTILADDMGLGKTLQCITLIWTLLKKGPHGRPILRRVLIITPSSLCKNWDKEFVKWLGSHRISPYVVDGKNKPRDFTRHPRNTVMIVSYEMLMRCHEEINEITFDLIVCDEGHRLKNSNAKVAKLLSESDCKRRIMLTGTPMQNDLKEFYALIDFVNPGVLGTAAEYKRYYEDPIVASQCPRADPETLDLGNERATELHELTKRFVLRRTQETINQYLPHKHEMVLFCSLSGIQRDLYVNITDAWFNKICMQDKSNVHMSIVTALKRVCNHPSLFTNNDSESTQWLLPQATRHTTVQWERDDRFIKYCGKVSVVKTLMRNLKKTDEKLVLVSYYTQTLDLLETVCRSEGLKFLRLDGGTARLARSRIVERFNARTDESKIFLLSAKAGGVGLNLSGASRLVLFDSDWNPASDAQAMARIWRDGQKRDVYIYRLLTTGTIEEKIYQRQISKAGLSESVVDLNHLGSLKLSTAELKDLFTLATDTASLTHDLMNCPCSDRNTELVFAAERNEGREETCDCRLALHKPSQCQNLTINQLMEWQHYKQPLPSDLMRNIMLMEVADNITYIFKSSTVPALSEHVQAH